MNTPIEIARLLIIECSKECPSLAEIQILCETTFRELRESLGFRPVHDDTDDESADPLKATWTAREWVLRRSIAAQKIDRDDHPEILFSYREEEHELYYLYLALDSLHKAQALRDRHYMNELRPRWKHLDDESYSASRKDECECRGFT